MLLNHLSMFYANEGQNVKISVHQPSLKTQHNRPPIIKLQTSKDRSKPVFPEVAKYPSAPINMKTLVTLSSSS